MTESEESYQKLFTKLETNKWPIVYRKEYNVHFAGLEKLHPFDAGKWGNIYKILEGKMLFSEKTVMAPPEATKSELLLVHTTSYLNSLKMEERQITDETHLFLSVMKRIKYQTGGSMVAGQLALLHGWAINLGGGFHHCSSEQGGGFCPYADITLLIRTLRKHRPTKAMIVDLDAHQGNGYERDFLGDNSVFILDVYNFGIYPQDQKAKAAIRCRVELKHYTCDTEYLDKVERNLEKCLSLFHPDILVYNAGTDILEGDPLGRLSITSQGIIRRDELVFMKARERRVPIVMLTSGGYLKQTAAIIADSIINLFHLGLIS